MEEDYHQPSFFVHVHYKGEAVTIKLMRNSLDELSAKLEETFKIPRSQQRLIYQGKKVDMGSDGSTASLTNGSDINPKTRGDGELPFPSNAKVMFLPQASEDVKTNMNKEVKLNVRVRTISIYHS